MRKPTSLTRWTATALIALGAGLGATAAQAGGVQWSIGVHLPMPGVVVYPQQPPVVVAPQPVYAPGRPVYVQPEPVYMARPRHHHHHHHHHHRHHHDEYDESPRHAPRGYYGW